MAADLTHHHRVTLEKIFSHPLSGNVEWRQVLGRSPVSLPVTFGG